MKMEIIRGTARTILEYDNPVLLSTVFAQHGVGVEMPCGGRQRCLKCRVKAFGALSPLSERERELLTPEEIAAGIRFACMTEMRGDVRVELPDTGTSDRIVTAGQMPDFPFVPWEKGLGAAVDIGTTTVALYLYDLENGRLLDTGSERNPQAVFGADVISRMEKAMAGEADALAVSIRNCIARMLTEACDRTEADVQRVNAMVLTGNTVMLYLLCRQHPASIAAAPFIQDRYFGEFLTAADLNLPLHKNAQIYLPRCMSAYVGADITTALMAASFDQKLADPGHEPELLVDIGTNGEMALAAGGKMLCCSTAAGPAFEGAGIYQGMNAKEGAVSRVFLENGKIRCSVIGGVEAKGICGSGIVDAVAVMVKAGILDETGIINEEDHAFEGDITEVEEQPAFRLPGTQVVITQKDIRAVQLAKSAVCSGMLTLIEEAGMQPKDVKRLTIAGGFGAFIDVQSAQTIGLIPPGFAAKAVAVGNAAGTGASMVLLSEEVRRSSEKLAKRAETVELSSSPRFMDYYVENMLFTN